MLTQTINNGLEGVSGGGGGGTGDVVGPASSTDNAIARWDGVTGKLLQNSVNIIDDNGNTTLNQVASTSGTPTLLKLIGAAHTNLTAGIADSDVVIDLGRTVQFATGNITLQKTIEIKRPTYDFVGPSNLATAICFYIDGVPLAGPNASLNVALGLGVDHGLSNANIAANAAFGWPGISNGVGNVIARAQLFLPPSPANISLGDQTAGLSLLANIIVFPDTFESTANVRTVGVAAGILVVGPPVAGPNVVFTDGPYSIFIQSGTSRFDGPTWLNGNLKLSTVVVNADITISELDPYIIYRVETSAARAITLPLVSLSGPGKYYTFKDETGTGALTNNITLIANVGDNIDGIATFVINVTRGGVTLYSDATTGWHVI